MENNQFAFVECIPKAIVESFNLLCESPFWSKSQGGEPLVLDVEMLLHPKGYVSNTRLKGSSGTLVFDGAVLHAISHTDFPAHDHKGPLKITLTFSTETGLYRDIRVLVHCQKA